MFLGKGVLVICSKFTGEHPCWSAISTKLLCNFIVITLRHRCSLVNLLHIFRTPFLKNTSGQLLLINLPLFQERWKFWVYCHTNIKKPFYLKNIFLIENEGVLHSFSTKNTFHDKMDLIGFFYFHVTTYKLWRISSTSANYRNA